MPSVSVIIPAYNSQDTILEAIASVFNQTFTDLEVLVIDDGSTDNTCEYVRSIDDDRLKLLSYENGGVSVARNRGIANAKGEYISFLDHDDLWTFDKLAEQVAALQQSPNAGVAYSWTTIMFSDEDPVRYRNLGRTYFEGDVYAEILVTNFVCSGSNILVRKEAAESIGEFDPSPTHNEDWDYYIRLAAKWHFALVPKYQIIYRQTSTSASSNARSFEEGGLLLADKAYQAAPEKFQHLKKRFLYNHYIYSTQLYSNSYINSIEQISRLSLKEGYRTVMIAIACMPSGLIKLTTFKMLLKLLLVSVLGSSSIKQLKKARYLKMERSKTTSNVRAS